MHKLRRIDCNPRRTAEGNQTRFVVGAIVFCGASW